MITSIQFENFKVLKDARLPLGRFTLIVGPNGSGKTTAINGLSLGSKQVEFDRASLRSKDAGSSADVSLTVNIRLDEQEYSYRYTQRASGKSLRSVEGTTPDSADPALQVQRFLAGFRIFAFDATRLASPVALHPGALLQKDGVNFAAVLDSLRDGHPERFDALNDELGRWFPEFDRILFETPGPGTRNILLRTRAGHHAIRAADLSEGTLLALAYLTLAYLPDPPTIVAFEEPDRGIHPRLLREIRDAMYRLSYPENYGENRPPVQVIAITHSPYLLDLYKDHPEEIVIAHKDGLYARFERLIDAPYIDELLQNAPLGEIWYSGVLGGVPAEA